MISIEHKIYPTKKQETYLEGCLWSSVGIANWVIGQLRNGCDEMGVPYKFMSPVVLRSIFSKKIEGHCKRCGLPSRLIIDCIASVLQTYKTHVYKKKERGRPVSIKKIKLKSARKKRSFYFNGDIKFNRAGRLKLPGIKTTFRISEMNKFHGKLKKATLIKKSNGWVVVCVYDEERQRIIPTDSKEAGIDPGLKTALVFSDGNEINFPKYYRENEDQIKKLSRKSKNSKKLKNLHRKIANKRKDFLHKKTTEIAKEYQKIYWSDDNFKNLKQFKNLGKSYSDFALGKTRLLLEAKLAVRNDGLGELIKVDNKYSTQTCSFCRERSFKASISTTNGLAVRDWTCIMCGTYHDRDVNAAVNTLISGRGASADKWNRNKSYRLTDDSQGNASQAA